MSRSVNMAKTTESQKINQAISLDEIHLDNVTLKLFGRDPILQSVDISLPMDQTLVIESSRPQNAVFFLQFLAGRLNCDSGQLLWNGKSVFTDEAEFDSREILASYFENHIVDKNLSVEAILTAGSAKDAKYDLIEMFEFESIKNKKIKELSYEIQKVVFLIQTVLSHAQILILEDPALGISEFHWLQLLDFIQFQQRRGHLRHIYMTNHHPTALRHLAYNRVFVEDGLIYFDEQAGYKKASHF